MVFDWQESAFLGFACEAEIAECIAKEVAHSDDPSDPYIQREICAKYGFNLETMPQSLAHYIESRIIKYL